MENLELTEVYFKTTIFRQIKNSYFWDMKGIRMKAKRILIFLGICKGNNECFSFNAIAIMKDE